MKLYELTIYEAHGLLKHKEISSQELTRAVLDRIAAVDDKIGAFITVAGESAIKEAKLADKAIAKGDISVSYRNSYCSKRSHMHKGNPHNMRF